MKIALAQLNYRIGDFDYNVSKIKKALKNAKTQGADLVVFPELTICAYPPLDFLEFHDFIQKCIESIKEVAEECIGIAAIVGGPSPNPDIRGKNLFNAAYFLDEGKIKNVHHKALLPNYDVFDEYRYFEPGRTFEIIEYKGERIALTICEDLWDVESDLMYTICPMDELVQQNPTIMINIAASPFSYNHAEFRKYILTKNAKKYRLPLFYVNHVGAHTELIFDGGSMVVDSEGNVQEELNYFEEDMRIYETVKTQAEELKIVSAVKSTSSSNNSSKIDRIYNALVLGIRDYFQKLGFTKAVLGLSGGIDSAVVLAMAAKALGRANVKGLLMPSRFSSKHSIEDAVQLARNIGCSYEIISIEAVFQSMEKTLHPYFKELFFNVAEENIQARIRGMLLMAFSNKFGYILLNTSNKSELAVGYGTLYGDLCGGISVIGDLYKTEVYELAAYINREEEVIPTNTIKKAPSAELRPDQKDQDYLPPYELLDKVLYQYIENKKSPQEIVAMGIEENIVNKALKLVNTNEYKRYQAPPILRVSPKAFGLGRRMPLVGKYLS